MNIALNIISFLDPSYACYQNLIAQFFTFTDFEIEQKKQMIVNCLGKYQDTINYQYIMPYIEEDVYYYITQVAKNFIQVPYKLWELYCIFGFTINQICEIHTQYPDTLIPPRIWEQISHQKLTSKIIEILKDKLDWNILSKQEVSHSNLLQFSNYWDWNILAKNTENNINYKVVQKLIRKRKDVPRQLWDIISATQIPKKFILKYHNLINWQIYSDTHIMTENTIDQYHSYLNFNNLNYGGIKTDRFIDKYIYQINWDKFAQEGNLSHRIIIKYAAQLPINLIMKYQKLNEETIRYIIAKNQESNKEIPWPEISKNQVLSEKFIEQHKYRLFWYFISQYQTLSIPFMEKYADFLNWKLISRYQILDKNFLNKYKNKKKNNFNKITKNNPTLAKIKLLTQGTWKSGVDWKLVSQYQKLSLGTLMKFKNQINWYLAIHYQDLKHSSRKYLYHNFKDRIENDKEKL